MRARRGSLLFSRAGNRRLRPRPGRPARPRVPLRERLERLGRALAFLAVAATCVGGTIAAVRYALVSPHFALAEIRIEGTRFARPEELRGRIGLPPAVNLFTIDTAAVERDVESNPWIVEAEAHRRLPDTLVVRVVEHEPRAAVLLGHLYLVDARGRVFKRATPDESADLPVITGVDRVAYVESPEEGERRLREALAVLDAYGRGRAPLSEVHLDDDEGPTLYTRAGAQIRLARDRLPERLARLDRVWASLGPELDRVRAILLDHDTRLDRVVVRLGEI